MENFFVVIGPPGTGKTTYLSQKASEAARKYGSNNILIASLTKTAAAEVAGRNIPIPKSQIGTLHAHAFRALGHPNIVEPKDLKDFNVYLQAHTDTPEIFATTHLSQADRRDLDEPKFDATRSGSDLLDEYTLLRSRRLPQAQWTDPNLLAFAALWEAWKASEDLLDFEDLIEVAARDCPYPLGHPKIIYLDEAQDLSTSEVYLVLQWAKNVEAVVAVLDPQQALYTWRGADPTLLLQMAKRKGQVKVLEQSYRVPQWPHAYAVNWINSMPEVEHFAYKPTATRGFVKRYQVDIGEGRPLLHIAEEYLEAGKSLMFLTSCDYMLKGFLAALRNAGLPFHNPYRVKRGDWNPLKSASKVLAYLRPDSETWGDHARIWNWEDLHTWFDVIETDLLLRGVKTTFKQFAEQHPASLIADTMDEALDTIRNAFRDPAVFNFDPHNFDGFRQLLKRTKIEKENELPEGKQHRRFEYILKLVERFGGARLLQVPQIIVGTIHSVKGGEADIVFVAPEISPQADEGLRSQKLSAIAEIHRLFYVAFTRAKEGVILLAPRNVHSVDFPSPDIVLG